MDEISSRVYPMNKYLEKIAADLKTELQVAGKAGKAILADKIGDVTGLAAGGYIGSKFDKPNADDPHKMSHKGALIGAGTVGTALMYHTIRNDLLKVMRK